MINQWSFYEDGFASVERMKSNVRGEIGHRPKLVQVGAYCSHVVVCADDLSSLDSIEMGEGCTIPKPVFLALKLVVANHNTADLGTDDFSYSYVPFWVSAVKLALVVFGEIAALVNTCANMPIIQFPGALGMNIRRSWCLNPVVEQTNVEFLNKGRHRRARKPAEEDKEEFHGDWIWVNDKTISTQSNSTPVPRNINRSWVAENGHCEAQTAICFVNA